MVPRIFLTALLLFAKRYEVLSQRCEYFSQPTLTTTSYVQPTTPYIFPTSIKQAPACEERRMEHHDHNTHACFSPAVYREDDDNDIRNLLYYFLLFALTKACGCAPDQPCGHQMSHCSNGGYGEGHSGCGRGCNCRGSCGCGGECCCCGKCRSGKDRGHGGGFGYGEYNYGEGFGSGGGCCCCGKHDCCHDCGCNGGYGYNKWDDYGTCGHGFKDEFDIFSHMKNGVVYVPYPIPFPCGCQEHKMCEDKVVLHGSSGNCNEANEINLIIKTDC